MKNSMSGHRSLMPTTGALIQFARSYQVGPIVAAPRAAETIRPFASDQIFQTIALCSKLSSELRNGHRLVHGVYLRCMKIESWTHIIQRISYKYQSLIHKYADLEA